ncbi:hypothetical protein [Methylomagnum sp.]
MAIALEFIDFIVPVAVIREKYPGGWEQCLRDHAPLIGGRVWFDDYLFHDGTMSPMDIRLLVEQWASMGFEPMDSRDGVQVWKDVCVVEAMFGGPTLPCDWIEFDGRERIAYLKGTEPGPTIGRNEMKQSAGNL